MKQKPLRVMSWNIGQIYTPHLRIVKYLFPFLNKGVLPARYLPYVAKTISWIKPQVVCLQEVRNAEYNPEKVCQLELLERSLKGYKGFYGPETGGGEHRALLVKQNFTVDKRFKVENIKAGRHGVGIAVYVPQKDAWIANLHLEYYDDDIRKLQVDKIFRWIKHKKENVILAGDYNMRKSCYLTEKYQTQVHDFFANMKEKYNFRDASEKINHTHLLKAKIDYFLANFAQKHKEKTFALTDKRWRFMDHYPIVGDFVIDTRKKWQKAVDHASVKRRWIAPQ